MKVFNALAGLAVAAGLVATGLAAPAQASVTPVIYNYADGWMSPMIRPVWTTIGEGGSPLAHTWDWSTWNSQHAISSGTLWVDNCIPDCALGKNSYHKLLVTVWDVKSHDGQAYYSIMAWYTPGYREYGQNTDVMTMRTDNGFWNVVSP
jgi:hypothetical protein